MMPAHNSNRRTNNNNGKKWSSGGSGGGRSGAMNQRRDYRNFGSVQNRLINPGGRPVVSPWESGVTPGMSSGLMSSFAQTPTNYMVNPGMNRSNFDGSSYGSGYGNPNKMRRIDSRMGNFDDQRGRGLLPSPSNAPLLGVAPPSFSSPTRGPEFLQQRMGNPWDSSFHSGGPRGLNSGYYPSRGRQDNNHSRRILKPRRPANRSSSSNNKSGGSRDARTKFRKGSVGKSPSSKEKEEKEKSSSAHSKELKDKQGESSPIHERTSDKEKEEDKEDNEEKDEEEVIDADKDDADKKDEEATKEDKVDDDSKEKDKKQQEDLFPVQALYCHICDLESFTSKKGYIRHLQGITHAKMAELYHAKNAATLELLNISAKLSEMRQRDKVLRRTGKKGQPVMKTTEQLLVQKWLKVGSCCGTKYKSPFEMEEHKLSIHHLKAKYLENLKKAETKEGEPCEEEEQDTPADEVMRCHNLLEQAKKDAEESPVSMTNLPAYDPSAMIGLEFIKKELKFWCNICKGQNFKDLQDHCQSHNHHNTIVAHLNQVEDDKREAERKEEEKKKEEEAKEKLKEEKAKLAEIEEAKKKEEKSPKKKSEDEEEMEEDEEDENADYIMVDFAEDNPKDKSDEENEQPEEEEEEEEEDQDLVEPEALELDSELIGESLFEEVGEKLDFEEDLETQLKNGDQDEEEEEEEQQPKPEPEPEPEPEICEIKPETARRGSTARRSRRARGRRSK